VAVPALLMAASRQLLLNAFIRGAKLRATELGGVNTLTSVLESIILGRFKSEATNGRTVVSTSEAGGSVSFHFPDMLTPAEVMALAEEALEYCAQFSDPNNPPLTFRRIRRMRVSFAKGAI